VGTRVDGAAEVICDGVNGFLAEPGDIDGLAQRLLSLLDDPELARSMGKQGEALPSEFDIHQMVRRQEQEYERLMSGLTHGASVNEARELVHRG